MPRRASAGWAASCSARSGSAGRKKERETLMSRIGRMPISIPKGTKVEVRDGVFVAEGPKGRVEQGLFPGFPVEIEDGVINIARPGESGPDRSRHGLLRALLANAVNGAAGGFSKQLD